MKFRLWLLKIAEKIYRKYGFDEICEGKLFIFKNDLYRVVSTNLKQDVDCVDELTVILHKSGSLTEFFNTKIRKGDMR